MPKIVTLTNQHIAVQKRTEPRKVEGSDGVEMVEVWTLVLTDRVTQERLLLGIERDARDNLVKDLTDGIVLAGGSFPKLS